MQDTIRQMVRSLNVPYGDRAPFFLPAIQRDFVWKEEQTTRLFDSVMREYPIGTFLTWRTDSPEVRARRFVDIYRGGTLGEDIPPNGSVKHLVLDGQQRLQSFLIGLNGSYDGKELYFDVLSGGDAPPDDIRYGFAFRKSPEGAQWVKFKDLIVRDENVLRLAQFAQQQLKRDLSEEEREKISDNVAQAHQMFVVRPNIACQVLDSVGHPDKFKQNDVVEVFIRANSGGTRLSKSDLMFSLLVNEWDDAREQMNELLQSVNQGGYDFSRDFILKTCLTLLDLGAKYDVQKFRKEGVREQINEEWDNISGAIKCVRDFLLGKTCIRSDKAMTSYLGLIPVIYFRYKHPGQWGTLAGDDFRQYVGRTLLARSFSGSPDSLIDAVNRGIDLRQDFNLRDVFQDIRNNGRSVDFPKSSVLGVNYHSHQLHLLFNLWHPNANYQPAYSGNLPQVDHIFPQSVMRQNKIRAEKYHRIGNCMLLTAKENGAGGKSDKLPNEWFKGDRETDEYLDTHLIPKNRDLWRIEKFDEFLAEREQMIVDKFREMLVPENE